jgi:hypothetical protein
MNMVTGKASFTGEDSRLETRMTWAGASNWATMWAVRKEKEGTSWASFDGEAGFWPMVCW